MKIKLIAAIDKNNGIGYDGKLLAQISSDLKRFKELTNGSPIVMGSKTFKSLPNGALPNRLNIVLSQDKYFNPANAQKVFSINDILESNLSEIFVIGGQSIYNKFIDIADELYITHIMYTFSKVDAYFPSINPDKWIIAEESPILLDQYRYKFIKYVRK